MSSSVKVSSSPNSPASPLWVPSVQEWSAISWHQRQQFVQVRRVSEKVLVQRVPEKVRVLVECEKAHVEDLPPAVDSGQWDEIRMHHEMVLMRRREAARLAAATVSPVEGDRHWNELAVAIGNECQVRYVG